MFKPPHFYEVRLREDHRGADLISEALPFGRLWYEQAPDAVDYAKFFSRSYRAAIRVYDAANNVIETHERTAIIYYHRLVGVFADCDQRIGPLAARKAGLRFMIASKPNNQDRGE